METRTTTRIFIGLLLCTAPAAWAQQEATPDQPIATVTVTGSRIARPELDRLQPTVVVGSEQIDERASTNVIDVLNELPAFGIPDSSKVGAQPSSFGVAQSFADFFSLGSQRTLTLVNGHRFVSSNTASIFGPTDAGQQVDLNTIPTKLIERVEVIAVGGAPIYGSDAIAGTVNVILKKDFQGLEVDALSGISDEGDGFTWRARALGGMNFADDRGNVVANVEFTKSRGLLYTERDITNQGLFFTNPADPDSPFDQVVIPNRRVGLVNFGGLPMVADSIPQFAGIVNDAGQFTAFAPDGRLVPYDFGGDTGNIVNNIGGDGIDFAPLSNLVSPTQRALFTTLVNFDLSDRLHLYGEGWMSNTRGTRLADQPVYNTALFGAAGDPDGNLIVSIDHPLLPVQTRALIQQNLLAQDPDPLDPSDGVDPSVFYMARANTDLVSGEARGEVNLYRAVAGLTGEFALASRPFNWEVALNYGRSEGESKEPSLVEQNFLNALDAVVDPMTGRVVCAASLTPGGVVSAPIPTLSSTCEPLNIFGLGAPSQAAADYVTTLASQESTITQRVVTANVGGEIFKLPAGAVAAVLGYENRRETSKFEPDQFFREALGRSIPIGPLSGEFETDEFFTELLIPLLSDEQSVPLVHELQFEGAARYVDHSIAGGDTTWTAGLRFSPVADLQFRGNKTHAIRSPAITEAFVPTSEAFETADDPCDAQFIDSGPNPAQRAANCAAAGITQPFSSDIVNFTLPVTVSGNLNLLNEEADSETYGFVLRPRWVPRLSLAVDWIKIDLADAIVTLDSESTLEACYDSPNTAANPLCANIDRGTDGQVITIRTGYANAGSKKFEGITAQLNYDFDLPSFGREAGSLGRMAVALNWFDLRKLETRVGLGDLDREAGEIGDSKHQGVLRLNYLNRGFSWQIQSQYIGSAAWDVDEEADTRDFPRVRKLWLFDTTLGYEVSDNFTVRAIIDNVFDRRAPFPVPAGGGVITYYDAIFGRNYTLSMSYQF